MGEIRIGITSGQLSDGQGDVSEVGRHCTLIESLGAHPVPLPKDLDASRVVKAYRLSGILFSGGGDVNADRYGGRASLTQEVDDMRDAFEMALMEIALADEVPTLGVCRGLQIANVVLGGTLIEHLPEHLGPAPAIRHHQVKDSGLERSAYAHDINVPRSTALYDIVRTDVFRVNSFHHQAIRDLAPSLVVAAHSEDGVIEAVERAATGFFVGIQWHPELLHATTGSILAHLPAIHSSLRRTQRPKRCGKLADSRMCGFRSTAKVIVRRRAHGLVTDASSATETSTRQVLFRFTKRGRAYIGQSTRYVI